VRKKKKRRKRKRRRKKRKKMKTEGSQRTLNNLARMGQK